MASASTTSFETAQPSQQLGQLINNSTRPLNPNVTYPTNKRGRDGDSYRPAIEDVALKKDKGVVDLTEASVPASALCSSEHPSPQAHYTRNKYQHLRYQRRQCRKFLLRALIQAKSRGRRAGASSLPILSPSSPATTQHTNAGLSVTAPLGTTWRGPCRQGS